MALRLEAAMKRTLSQQTGSIKTGLASHKVTATAILPDSRGSGRESQRVTPSVDPAPEWLKWPKALRGQGMGWEG